MSTRAGTQAAGHLTGRVLAILVDRNDLSLRELVWCFMSCKAYREFLDSRGFCIGTAWLCLCLGTGRSPTEMVSKLRSARRSVEYDRPMSRVDQVTSFLTRHEDYLVRWGWAWAQLLYQEPDGGVLCEGVKKMLWLFKSRLITELHKSTGYHPGVCTLKGHPRAVHCVAWSPDSKLVVSGSDDSTVRIWDVATGKGQMFPLMGHSNTVLSVAWSPDGKLVASGSYDNTIRTWDTATGKEVMGILTGRSNKVTCIAWSPDGKLVASGSWDNTIRIWDVATGKEAMDPLKGHLKSVFSVAWSPDGKLVASGSDDRTVRIWDVATGKEAMGPLKGHSGPVFSVAWSSDGKLAASGSGDFTVKLWNVETGKEMYSLKGHSQSVATVAWSPDGKLVASGGWDNTIRFWDVGTGKEVMGPLTGHSKIVASVAWSPDGKLVASGSGDCTVRIWDVATGMEAMTPLLGSCESWVDVGPEIRALGEQVRLVNQDVTAPTGNYIVTADADTIFIYEAVESCESGVGQEAEPVALFRCPSRINAVACRPPYICAGCVGGQVLLLDAPLLCEGPDN